MTTTILHLTDLHLLSDPKERLKGIPTRETLRAVLEHVRRSTGDIAKIVITGDCTHDEQRSTYMALREMLGDLLNRCLFVPGNHDDPDLLRELFPECIPPEPDRFLVFSEPVAGWQLIGLHTHWSGEVAGRIETEQVEWLRCELDRMGDRPCGLFLHHPPVPVGCEWLDLIGLREPELLLELVGRHPNIAFLCAGHVHHESEQLLGTTMFYTTPSTGIQFVAEGTEPSYAAIPPGYRVIELDGRSFETTVRRLPELRYPPDDS